MRWLVTGAGGLLGGELRRALADRDATFLTRAELDITDPDAVAAAVADHAVVVNAAAYTRVDDAETDEAAAFAVNATGAGNLARAAEASGARLLQLSTDYVFDGTANAPYLEDAPLHPINAYGRSKAEGERLVLSIAPKGGIVVRTSWLYGGAGDFPSAVLGRVRSTGAAQAVDDQIGQPTWARDLAERLVALVDADVPAGVYHATASGQASRFEQAQAVLDAVGLDPSLVTPVSGSAFPRPAARPAWSVLGHDAWARVGMPPLRDWREAIDAAARAGAIADPRPLEPGAAS